jgi:hypothetical protein
MSKSESVKFHDSDDTMVIKKTYDFTENLKRMKRHRESGTIGLQGETNLSSDYRFIGEIPLPLIQSWLAEAGVSWDDKQARSDVIKTKILSGEFDGFRSDWKGKY